MTNEEIVEELNSTKSPNRRRAAKEIGKKIIVELGDELYKKYLEEIKDKKTWETQCEMIKALGIINYKKAMGNIEKIVTDNISHDALTICAATTYVQLKRQSLNDGLTCIGIIGIRAYFSNYRVFNGMFSFSENFRQQEKLCSL
jgi:hypothetical protein